MNPGLGEGGRPSELMEEGKLCDYYCMMIELGQVSVGPAGMSSYGLP